MKRRTKWILGVGGVVLVGAVGPGAVMSRRPEKVTEWTEKAQRKDLQVLVTANGTVQAKTKVDLSSNIMGQIVTLAVREGGTVKKDDLLLVSIRPSTGPSWTRGGRRLPPSRRRWPGAARRPTRLGANGSVSTGSSAKGSRRPPSTTGRRATWSSRHAALAYAEQELKRGAPS